MVLERRPATCHFRHKVNHNKQNKLRKFCFESGSLPGMNFRETCCRRRDPNVTSILIVTVRTDKGLNNFPDPIILQEGCCCIYVRSHESVTCPGSVERKKRTVINRVSLDNDVKHVLNKTANHIINSFKRSSCFERSQEFNRLTGSQ